MKLSTAQHENLNCLSWNSRPLNMEILTVQYENLFRSTWKSWPFITKISTFPNKISITRNKISIACNKISTVCYEIKSQLLAKIAFHRKSCGSRLPGDSHVKIFWRNSEYSSNSDYFKKILSNIYINIFYSNIYIYIMGF